MIYAYGCGRIHIDSTNKPASVAATSVFVVADTMEEADAAAESIADGEVACGWAFDAGMLEAERDDARMAIEDLKEIAEVLGDAAETLKQEHAAALPAAVAAERERLKEWGGVMILSQIEEANETSAAPRGGQTVGPSSNPWTRVPVSVRTAIARDVRDLFKHIESGAPAPREG